MQQPSVATWHILNATWYEWQIWITIYMRPPLNCNNCLRCDDPLCMLGLSAWKKGQQLLILSHVAFHIQYAYSLCWCPWYTVIWWYSIGSVWKALYGLPTNECPCYDHWLQVHQCLICICVMEIIISYTCKCHIIPGVSWPYFLPNFHHPFFSHHTQESPLYQIADQLNDHSIYSASYNRLPHFPPFTP